MESSRFTLDEGSVNWWTKSDASCDFFLEIKVLLQHRHARFSSLSMDTFLPQCQS